MEERAIGTSQDDVQLVSISRALFKWVVSDCPERKEEAATMDDCEVIMQVFRGAVTSLIIPAIAQALKMDMIPTEGIMEIFDIVRSVPGVEEIFNESERKEADAIFSALDRMGINIKSQ